MLIIIYTFNLFTSLTTIKFYKNVIVSYNQGTSTHKYLIC